MRVEIPECRRCCFCFPLRHGILVFGYINLIFSILLIILDTFISIQHYHGSHTMTFYKGVSFYSQNWLALVLYTTDFAFNIVLLVGAHMKRTRLLRAFYYYGVTTTLASLVVFIVIRNEDLYHNFFFYILEGAFVFCNIGCQVYLLLLIRSELLKIRQSSRLCYVNHATEVVIDTPLQTGRNPF